MGKRRTKDMSEQNDGAIVPLEFKSADNFEAFRKKKGCTDKIPYYSFEQADSVALNVRANRREKVYPYECQYEDHWHIGHRFTD